MEVFGTRVQDLLAYLHRHREDEIKQEWGCMALMIMCQDNTENRRIAGEQGAIQAVVDALHRHRGNKEVQKQGLMALASMCRDNTENKRIAGEQGAIQAVVNALNCHRANKEVRATGHRALVIMCQDNTENMRIAREQGAIQAVRAKSFQEYKADAGDLLYSAFRGVEGALKAFSGSGDDTSSPRRRLGDANSDEAGTGS